MATPKPMPLYPTLKELRNMDQIVNDESDITNTIVKSLKLSERHNLNEYPELTKFLSNGEPWWQTHWQWGRIFLEYIGRNKSTHTYERFRNEIERFLLWSFLIKQQPIDQFRKDDILEYADFCWRPPVTWVGTKNTYRYKIKNGAHQPNRSWRPYKISFPKSQEQKDLDKKRYRPSQQTLMSAFTAVIVFYNYLVGEEFCYGNPAQVAKHDCKHFIVDSQVKEVKRLTGEQWSYVLDTAFEMANSNSIYERNLFVIAALKTLFLRISELSERTHWSPIMGHFWEDENENWWLKVYGKGRKIRDITVPLDFLPFIERYRKFRNLSELPSANENTVLVEKIRGQGGMTSRHLRRLVQEVFDLAYDNMKNNEGEKKAKKLQEASTHWLRHTGASMEIERGRALKDLSEDLGHASMATTDTIYVQTENKRRADSGKKRKVT